MQKKKVNISMTNEQKWDLVIGLEVHAQVLSNSKLFSGAPTAFGAQPNTQVDVFDIALPGTLPVLNRYCVEQAIKTGMALHSKINRRSVFDRKNYFYPDLPAGYQISQFHLPICEGGYIEIDLKAPQDTSQESTKSSSDITHNHEPYHKRINVERLHLEQDAGKALHDIDATHSFLDFNRAGVALMEIVSKPEITSIAEAQAYVRVLRTLLRYVGTCDGNMEQGSLRVDINISLKPHGSSTLGTRCEVKNVNSIRFMGQAIEYECKRQAALLGSGGKVLQETRLFDPKTGKTRSMRSKEDAQDYRYFADPNLPPVVVEEAWIEGLRKNLPELPDEKRSRFMREYGLGSYEASILVAEKETANYYEQVIQNKIEPKLAANWVIGELFAFLKRKNVAIDSQNFGPHLMSELLVLIQEGKISGPIAKKVFEQVVENGDSPLATVTKENLFLIDNSEEIESIVDDIIAENKDKFDNLKEKPKLLGWFVGQVMQKTAGKANPQTVNEILQRKMKG